MIRLMKKKNQGDGLRAVDINGPILIDGHIRKDPKVATEQMVDGIQFKKRNNTPRLTWSILTMETRAVVGIAGQQAVCNFINWVHGPTNMRLSWDINSPADHGSVAIKVPPR